MSASSFEEDAGDASPQPHQLPAEGVSRKRFTSPRGVYLERALDAMVVVWIGIFHHVLGIHYRFAQISYDEHYFLNEGWSVVKGQVPYRDFQEFKPPVIFFANALGIELFGLDGLGYRKFLALLSLAGFLALTIALLSRRMNRLLVAGLLMLAINHFCDDGLHNLCINDAETFALDFFLMGVGVLLTRTKWERTQQVLGGVLLALTPLSKEPIVYATATAWLSLLFFHRAESGRKDAARRFAIFTLAGVSGVALTWLVYMLATRSLGWYILQLKLSFAYTRNYAYQLRWATPHPKGGAFAETLRRLAEVYLDAAHLAVFIPFFVALVTLSGQRRLAAIFALATFGLALYGVSIGQGFTPHYFVMAMTGLFLCVALGALALDEVAKRSNSELWHWVGMTWLGIALALTLPRFAAERKAYRSYKLEPLPVAQSDIDFVRGHTSPGDKIWTTDDPLLYVFSDRESAFRGGIVLDDIIEYYPGDTDEERLSVIRDGLDENRPKLIIFGNNQVSARRKQRYTRALVVPFLRDNGYIELNDRFYLRPD